MKQTNFDEINCSQVESLSKSSIAKHIGDINEVLKAAPELNSFPVERWEETYNFLKAEGFPSMKFAYMITQNPKLVSTSHQKIFESLNSWRGYQFGSNNIITLFARYPELLNMQHSNELNSKIMLIKQYVGGGNHIFKVLLNSPSVLTQNLADIKEKIDYLQKVMRVEENEVLSSEALSLDIVELKTRHTFLKRLGLYIAKKKKDSKEVSKNPKLYLITDTSDKRFAAKVCHVTLDEFETFQELYKRELLEEAEHPEDEEDDDEEEIIVQVDANRM